MQGFNKLELSTETLRELTQRELTDVAGGNQEPTPPAAADRPSGATWFVSCESIKVICWRA